MVKGCPTPTPGCKYATNGGCFASDHHVYFPKREYRTSLERKFRNLFVVNICRRIHDELHAINEPPAKPQHGYMQEIVNQYRR